MKPFLRGWRSCGPVIFCMLLVPLLLAHARGASGESAGDISCGHEKTKLTKGVFNMPFIELKVSPVKDEALAGESLEIMVCVVNRGGDPVEVHDPEAENPFIFDLLPLEDDRVLHSFSETKYRVSYNPQPRPRRSPEMVEIDPGATLEYRIDLGELFTEPVFPGPYRLLVSYPLEGKIWVSPATEIFIAAPDVLCLSSLLGRQTSTLASAFIHRRRDGSRLLMQRESRPDHPGLGVTFPRRDLGHDGPPASVVLAVNSVDSEDRPAGRWLAWIEQDRIGAAWGWGKTLMGEVGPIPTGLDSSRPIEPGLRIDGPHATFLAVGEEGGRQKIRAFTFTFVPKPAPLPESDSKLPTLAPLESEKSSPPPPVENPMIRTFDPGFSLPGRVLARYVPGVNGPSVQLVWVETVEGVSRIYRSSFSLQGPGAALTRDLLLERKGEPVALEMEPAGDPGTGVVDVLFGPEGRERRMTYFRIPMTDTGATTEWTFLARGMLPPPTPEGAGTPGDVEEPEIEHWAISPIPAPEAPVLAKVKDRLVYIRAAQPAGWTVLVSGVEVADHMGLFGLYFPDRYRGRLWATWVEPAKGIQYRRVY